MDFKDFLAGYKRPAKRIETSVGDGFPDIYVRALTAGEIRMIEKAKDNDEPFLIARYGVCKQDGSDLFTDADIDLIKRTLKLEHIVKINDAIREMSQPKEPAEIEKN